MANLNKVIMIGNLTHAPELRNTPSGKAVAEIRLAVNRKFGAEGQQTETTFLDVTCWGRTAEVACQYLQKGSSVFIEGRLQLDSWDDRQTGQKRTKLRIIAENFQMLGGNSFQNGNGSQVARAGNTHTTQHNQATQHRSFAQRDDRQGYKGYSQPEQAMPHAQDEDLPF